MSNVSSVRIRGLDFKHAIEDSLTLLDYTFDKGITKVVIKPNMCYYWDYSTGETTDPRFVGALIEVIREQISSDVDISIVEADASAMKCKHAFKLLGYEKLSKVYGVNLVNLSEDKHELTKVWAGGSSFNLMIPETIKNAGLRINVPKIKYTARPGIKITCALKNIFGCNPYNKKFRYHPMLSEAIVATNKAMKFDLCIIDGNIVSGISPRKLKLVMASTDSVAIDAAASVVAGVNPKTIHYINLASKEGLGNPNFKAIGESLDYFRARYPCRTLKSKLMGNAYKLLVRTRLSKRLGLT